MFEKEDTKSEMTVRVILSAEKGENRENKKKCRFANKGMEIKMDDFVQSESPSLVFSVAESAFVNQPSSISLPYPWQSRRLAIWAEIDTIT